ncbi:MAG: hypothetical protein CL666_11025 [Balneola sp.]|nr:hypothetical protein [Balneola sp.]|tara:strand:- start:44066 stop:46090 length:2025 start_codon:yes stop_codon:yes gene_type:complete
MKNQDTISSPAPKRSRINLFLTLMVSVLIAGYACSSSSVMDDMEPVKPEIAPKPISEVNPPSPDPRVGLGAGVFDAEEAIWNLEMLSQTPPTEDFVGVTNSDLAFQGTYAFQGNYNGVMIWDVSNPRSPELVTDYLCPASQSDVSVYGNLMFVSGEGFGGRLDCGTEGVQERVSEERLRGIRIFDITNIEEPEYVANVQTCRGSHTHSVLKDPNDDENVFVYVSGSAPVRPEDELPGCVNALPDEDPNSALFRIEVIKVPLNNPQDAAIVNSPRIFENLDAAPTHGLAPAEKAELEKAREEGAYIAELFGQERVIPNRFVNALLQREMEARGGTEVTAADSASLRENLQSIVDEQFGGTEGREERGPNQCHDITLYPEIGLAGGACEGYGLLLDITDPANPVRVDAVADSNFSYWHSATFSNDGSKVLFTDEWGGGGQPKCRESDPYEWGANALFTINDNNQMEFQSYYKLPAPQSSEENCVAHNGSLIPVPDRDIMVQSWYQGGISVFDWTDISNPIEIAYHDRGPVDADRMQMGGSWSVYWYNGLIINSEIARGLDIFELTPNPLLTRNEIEAANTVTFEYLNPQGQPKFTWPTTFVLAKAYVDQLDRNDTLGDENLTDIRTRIAAAEKTNGSERSDLLTNLADRLEGEASATNDSEKVEKLAQTLRDLAAM